MGAGAERWNQRSTWGRVGATRREWQDGTPTPDACAGPNRLP